MICFYNQDKFEIINEGNKKNVLIVYNLVILFNCFIEHFSINSAKITISLGQTLKIIISQLVQSKIYYIYEESLSEFNLAPYR